MATLYSSNFITLCLGSQTKRWLRRSISRPRSTKKRHPLKLKIKSRNTENNHALPFLYVKSETEVDRIKGQKKRIWTLEQKIEIVRKYLEEHVSVGTLAKIHRKYFMLLCQRPSHRNRPPIADLAGSRTYAKSPATQNTDGSYSFEIPAGVTGMLVVISGDGTSDGKILAADKSRLNAVRLKKTALAW